MIRNVALMLLVATSVVLADDTPEAKQDTGAARTKAEKKEEKKEDATSLGMSVLGNQEAPKALVIVPWKSSEIGASLGSSTMLDDSRQPIDKEVFMRVLSYYEVRSTTTSHDTAQPAAAPHRR